MKQSKLNPISQKQKIREAQRKQVIEELKIELGDKCEVCGKHEPNWIPITGHEITFRSKGEKSCKMDRKNIILLDWECHGKAHARQLTAEYLQEIVRKRNEQRYLPKSMAKIIEGNPT